VAGQGCKWPEKHYQEYKKRGLESEWCQSRAPDESTLLCFPGLCRLVERHFELLHLAGVTEFPESTCRTIEVSQMIGRDFPRAGQVATLTPTGMKYVTSRCRCLVGVEALRLQSLWFGECESDRQQLDSMAEEVLLSLAGNAFEGSCCVALIFAACVFLSTGAARTELTSESITWLRTASEDASSCSGESLDEDPPSSPGTASSEGSLGWQCPA